ncbi:MAG: 23S rRNA (pseudouridine(1915)-N(3))-methyltransferase RlmH [Muribaculaceae bacterium]|nr:23S rRNA (pseudouridine(1915)-N(3))-methyltransferase RlmH [Muribaculaceae bacterium]
MDIVLLSIGKVSSSWIKEGISLFESRIEKYLKFVNKELPDIKNGKSLAIDKIKELEGKILISEFCSSDIVVLLDEKGKEFSSRDFSVWVQKQLSTGKKRLIFVIGGPYGFSEEVYKKADFKISLSKMTFTHEMAKLFFTEQIYRAMTILKGEPYHHD